jgi:hypothetical protein
MQFTFCGGFNAILFENPMSPLCRGRLLNPKALKNIKGKDNPLNAILNVTQNLPVPSSPVGHVHDEQFEAILQSAHIWVRVLPEFEAVGDDFYRPCTKRGILPRLETEIEEAWIFWVDAEGVHATLWIGLSVRREPLF